MCSRLFWILSDNGVVKNLQLLSEYWISNATTRVIPPECWIFKMASLCYFLVSSYRSALFALSKCNLGSISSFWYVLQLLNILDSEIWKKIHEEDLKQTRRPDRPVYKKKLRNYSKCEFSNFFLFQWLKMIISVLVTWMIVDCNLAVRVVLSFFSCAL